MINFVEELLFGKTFSGNLEDTVVVLAIVIGIRVWTCGISSKVKKTPIKKPKTINPNGLVNILESCI